MLTDFKTIGDMSLTWTVSPVSHPSQYDIAFRIMAFRKRLWSFAFEQSPLGRRLGLREFDIEKVPRHVVTKYLPRVPRSISSGQLMRTNLSNLSDVFRTHPSIFPEVEDCSVLIDFPSNDGRLEPRSKFRMNSRESDH